MPRVYRNHMPSWYIIYIRSLGDAGFVASTVLPCVVLCATSGSRLPHHIPGLPQGKMGLGPSCATAQDFALQHRDVYLELQSTQNHGPCTRSIILGALEVHVDDLECAGLLDHVLTCICPLQRRRETMRTTWRKLDSSRKPAQS